MGRQRIIQTVFLGVNFLDSTFQFYIHTLFVTQEFFFSDLISSSKSREGIFMKRYLMIFLILTQIAHAESPCDIKLGQSQGVRVVEFSTDNVIHSKIPLREVSVMSLKEEMTSLQDMGICEAQVSKKRCVLRFERKEKGPEIAMFRGEDRWLNWGLNGKTSAQKLVRILKQAGFCV